MSGGRIEEGLQEGIKKRFAEGGASVVDVDAGGQAGEVGVAVGVGQVGQADSVAGYVDATAADLIFRSGAVATMGPLRLSWGRGGARVCHA